MSDKDIINNHYDGDLGPILNKQKANHTSIEIDFTGEELMMVAKACVKDGITFNEFIDRSIRNYLYNTENRYL